MFAKLPFGGVVVASVGTNRGKTSGKPPKHPPRLPHVVDQHALCGLPGVGAASGN